MIIREAPVDSPWYRAAVGWFIAFCLTTGMAFVAFEGMGYDIARIWPWLWVGPSGALVLYLIGRFRPKTPERVLTFILVMGGFGMMPMLLCMTLCGMGYFLLTPHVDWLVWSVRISFVVAAIWWSWRELRALQRRIAERRFIQKEFHVEEDRVTISRVPRTDIERPPVSDATLFGKAFNHLGPYLVMLIPIAYPLQRLLKDSGGIEAVLLFTSALLIPLTIHTLSQMVCGTYLWVYVVWRLERQYGKPVMFAVK